MKKLIYLASPYSGTPFQRQQRFLLVNRVAAELVKEYHVFSPISHTHPIKESVEHLGGDWDQWCEYDFRMLECCDELHVLKADGWGVIEEIKLAHGLQKPVHYIEKEFYENLR